MDASLVFHVVDAPEPEEEGMVKDRRVDKYGYGYGVEVVREKDGMGEGKGKGVRRVHTFVVKGK